MAFRYGFYGQIFGQLYMILRPRKGYTPLFKIAQDLAGQQISEGLFAPKKSPRPLFEELLRDPFGPYHDQEVLSAQCQTKSGRTLVLKSFQLAHNDQVQGGKTPGCIAFVEFLAYFRRPNFWATVHDSQTPKGVHTIVQNCPGFGRTKNIPDLKALLHQKNPLARYVNCRVCVSATVVEELLRDPFGPYHDQEVLSAQCQTKSGRTLVLKSFQLAHNDQVIGIFSPLWLSEVGVRRVEGELNLRARMRSMREGERRPPEMTLEELFNSSRGYLGRKDLTDDDEKLELKVKIQGFKNMPAVYMLSNEVPHGLLWTSKDRWV
ncbi:hypothetical protein M405DRAFT_847144 [Rhizopogon salebrosus TDB-379]|nr:hypothetical protein M405DRAFT_847144 [Rhizopogon salebrosus TDB-379]